MSLLNIEGMRVEFPDRHGVFTAVKDVSLTVEPGEILGVVGESGAGKSTIGNALIDLLQPPGKMVAGKISLNDKRIDQLSDEKRRELRGKRISMIFQDPLTSLNPIERLNSNWSKRSCSTSICQKKVRKSGPLTCCAKLGSETLKHVSNNTPTNFRAE